MDFLSTTELSDQQARLIAAGMETLVRVLSAVRGPIAHWELLFRAEPA